MKALTIACILVNLLTLPFYTSAQDENTSYLSANAGLNSIWIMNQNMYGNQELDYATKLGIAGEVKYNMYLSKTGYSIGLGMLNLGQNYSGAMSDGDATRKVNLTYIEMPVMWMVGFVPLRERKWVMFGPQFMFLLSANQTFTRSGGNPLPFPQYMQTGTSDITKRFNPMDVMLAVELPQVISFSSLNQRVKWFFSVKAAYGLTDMNRKEYRIPNSTSVYKASHNFYFGVNLGVLSKLKER